MVQLGHLRLDLQHGDLVGGLVQEELGRVHVVACLAKAFLRDANVELLQGPLQLW